MRDYNAELGYSADPLPGSLHEVAETHAIAGSEVPISGDAIATDDHAVCEACLAERDGWCGACEACDQYPYKHTCKLP